MKRAALSFQRREWFYYIDHKVIRRCSDWQGLLFLEETEPKNYTSCLKDEKFLVISEGLDHIELLLQASKASH